MGQVNQNDLNVGDIVTPGVDWDRGGEAGVSGATGRITEKDAEGNLIDPLSEQEGS